ncbi:arabinofuranosidase [Stereum hirsutum FP-91666 SS1]|uniref:arabinofuranosidase n=1 Tax=Stereum hirsutum (strain FP-91666) TaxID=721885 RepID=UPI000440E529|nr:arabinofuranosidase [Stereum hirsutum FP-91666 SS1]EIM92579.1 arabinofuranosidase [Stereum hirsutum FP-91666 SS1]
MLLLLVCFYTGAVHAITEASSQWHNPILPGFHPDPSCTRVPEWNDTFFCATSSFNAVPGVPVFASKDLQNFRQIGNVITRKSQLPGLAATNGSTSGIWAPTIRYHEGTFYVVTTLVYDDRAANDSSRWDNIIFTSTNPYDTDSWSDPVHFTFEGYDTSPYWDSQGNSYIIGSHAWKIYEMIQGFGIDLNTGNITSDIHDMWPGTGGIAPEGPHVYESDGSFYLQIAEGGTGLNHETNYARSDSLFGNYTGDPENPVLTNANTTEYFQTVGHADLFNDTEGNWWTVALSTRSGPEFVYYPMGRETILTTAKWNEGEFPTFTPVRGVESGPLPSINKDISGDGYWVGSDDDITFESNTTLPNHFVYNRFQDVSAYTISPSGHPNTLALSPSVLNLTGRDARSAATPQTFVGRRQEHIEFIFEVTLEFNSMQDQAEAGVTVFLNQAQHFDLGVVMLSPDLATEAGLAPATTENNNDTTTSSYIRLRTITANSTNSGATDPFSSPAILPLNSSTGTKLKLQVEAVNHTTYAFRYTDGGNGSEWKTVGWGNSSQVSGGFTGTIVGLFTTGNGNDVTDPAYFSQLSYKGNHDVF